MSPVKDSAPLSENLLPGINAALLAQLLRGEPHRFDVPPTAEEQQVLASAGLSVAGQLVQLERVTDTLDAVGIQKRLSRRAQALWSNVEVRASAGSTNAELMALGADAAGRALTTEFQYGGRGRRGRTWISPVGRNLAVSLGFQMTGGLDRFAGLSLVVGLAVVDALRTLGLDVAWLKWPNDILVASANGAQTDQPASQRFAKLGGILVELQRHEQASVAVIGIGLNFAGADLARAQIDQPLGDIHELVPGLSRTEVLAGVVNALADYLEQFAAHGFEPMMPLWESLHAFSGREVKVISATEVIIGRVLGVTSGGALRVLAESGELHLDAGEVSLRAHSASD